MAALLRSQWLKNAGQYAVMCVCCSAPGAANSEIQSTLCPQPAEPSAGAARASVLGD